MRPGQNKRMRGRNNNNNRKGPNPLTRSYESNGPDVKIRGTAQHIAEKYQQLARDAQSSGDPVMAESYLQHAEHYFRIIAAAQQAQQQQQMSYRQQQDIQPDQDDAPNDEGDTGDRFSAPAERTQAILNQPQPSVAHAGNPFSAGRNDEGGDQPETASRQDRGGRNNRRQRNFDNGENAAAPNKSDRDSGIDDDGQTTLPSFITGAKGATGRDAGQDPGEAAENPRPRRRRRPMPRGQQANGEAPGAVAKADEVPAGE